MIRLSVHISEKEQVKRYGARWNPEGKFWYWPGEELPPELEPWALKPRGEAPQEELYLSVSRLSELIRQDYYNNPALRQVMVQGEVCNLNERKTQGGEAFLTFGLKDDKALLPCVIWPEDARRGLSAPLKNGQQAAAHGSLEYYSSQGKTQLVVRQIKEVGVGQASLALMKLKKQLEEEGLFSPEWKKPLPKHPKLVGIVTSQSGQAFQDIRDVAGRRNPYVQLVLYPVMVQGRQAVESIIRGIRYMDEYGADVLIVGRGGGSEEELSVYNDEALVRAVFAAKTPIVSAVGHAGNTSLTDLAADVRAATPSEAAELTVPDVMGVLRRLQALRRESEAGIQRQLLQKRRRLEVQKTALEVHHPRHLLEKRLSRLGYLRENLGQEMAGILSRKQNRFALLSADLPRQMKRIWEAKNHRFQLALTGLHSLSPTAKLVKGFGYIQLKGQPLTDVGQAKVGDAISVRIHNGALEAAVTAIERRQEDV